MRGDIVGTTRNRVMSQPPKRPTQAPFMKDGVQTQVPNQPRTGREPEVPDTIPGPQELNIPGPFEVGSPIPLPPDPQAKLDEKPGRDGEKAPDAPEAMERPLVPPNFDDGYPSARNAILESTLLTKGLSPEAAGASARGQVGEVSVHIDGAGGAATVVADGGPVTAGRGARPKKTRAKTLVNKAQAIREARILIAVLEDALNFRPVDRDNRPAPELYNQLNLENADARGLIRQLVAELKKLNEFLESNRRMRGSDKRAVGELEKVAVKVLKTYGNTVAIGAGILTIGGICTVLDAVGLHAVVENAMLWKNIGK